MDLINRLNSPMALYVEDLTEHPLELERRRETARKTVCESPASFLVGSVESVSQKMAHLEQHLNSSVTDDLVIESPETCGTLCGRFTPWSNPTEQRERSKECIEKKMERFTCRLKKSMTKTDYAKYPKTQESAKKEMKPRLVELCQFPGISYSDPLPLPHDISPCIIIEKVLSAHKNTGAKICSTRELHRILTTPVFQKILLDCYWWIFLDRYIPDAECQSTLFDRVAESYIQLLILCQGSYHGDAFLNVFPSVLSQAVYSSFCFSFPQSMHQFQSDDFKTELCNLLWQWFGGIWPISRVYNTWDYLNLEPKDDTTNMKIKQKKDSDALWFSLSNAEELNGFSSTLGFRSRKCSVIKPSRKNSSAANQTSLHKKEATISYEHLQFLTDFEARKVAKLKKDTVNTQTQECHSASHKTNVVHMAFNLHGHSPLVQYYLEKQKADSQAGVSVLVHWTETQKPA
ncbi:protein FAM227A [Dendrobates tinctorius]|uniref:protein FAM227A n=1 Tax=Dendrobates tinctorius TaxID=92724 RepID=UPI003CCA35F7